MSIFGTVHDTPAAPIAVPPPITAWSYSRLSTYMKCPRRAKYQFVDKHPEPEAEAIVRGKIVHALASKLILVGEENITALEEDEKQHIEVLRPWREHLKELRVRGALSEMQAAFDRAWKPTDWFGRAAWLRVVFDAVLPADRNGGVAHVFEFKTGKARPEHEQQKSLYAVSAAAMHPEAEKIKVSFVYFDQPVATGANITAEYDQATANSFRPLWESRSAPMLADTTFPAKPGKHCNWCPFSKTKGGPCDAA